MITNQIDYSDNFFNDKLYLKIFAQLGANNKLLMNTFIIVYPFGRTRNVCYHNNCLLLICYFSGYTYTFSFFTSVIE